MLVSQFRSHAAQSIAALHNSTLSSQPFTMSASTDPASSSPLVFTQDLFSSPGSRSWLDLPAGDGFRPEILALEEAYNSSTGSSGSIDQWDALVAGLSSDQWGSAWVPR
jgi:hypothetical protein